MEKVNISRVLLGFGRSNISLSQLLLSKLSPSLCFLANSIDDSGYLVDLQLQEGMNLSIYLTIGFFCFRIWMSFGCFAVLVILDEEYGNLA